MRVLAVFAAFAALASGTKLRADNCTGCLGEDLDTPIAYQTCVLEHGDPCSEVNEEGLVSKEPGAKRDIKCCNAKNHHKACMLNCSKYNTDVWSKYEKDKTDKETAERDAGWEKKAMAASAVTL